MNLSLEQCQKLKEWGYPQIVKEFDFTYLGGQIAIHFAEEEYETFNEILCPDLEQLWNGAEEIIREFRVSGNFSHIDIKRISPKKEDGFAAVEVYQPLPNYTFAGKDKDRKQAIYKLLEKIMSSAGTPAHPKRTERRDVRYR